MDWEAGVPNRDRRLTRSKRSRASARATIVAELLFYPIDTLQICRVVTAMATALLSMAGCGAIPLYSNLNKEGPEDKIVLRTDTNDWSAEHRKSNVFVGVAISGGGSRSANFSAAVLQELEKLGFLDHVTAFSSVSGGSLTAAYINLSTKESRTEGWWDDFFSRLRTDLLQKFVVRLFDPINIFLNNLTHYNRSNIMSEIFDDVLFDKKTFADLPETGPKLLINATEYGFQSETQTGKTPASFIFERGAFLGLGSGIDTYPVSAAVMASGAFPGVFNNVALRDYRKKSFFFVEDLRDPAQLASKLAGSDDPLSRYIRGRLKPETKQSLNRYKQTGLFSHVLLGLLLNDLNDLIYTEPASDLFERNRFAGIDLRRETRNALESKSKTKEELQQLNKLLLEDAYPDEIWKERPRYTHLFDGGPVDNLGLESIQWAADEAPPQNHTGPALCSLSIPTQPIRS
jgi:hypothetical protein